MANKHPSYPSLPKLQIKGSSLFLQSPFLESALYLFSHARRVHFSNAKKQVEIQTKAWWRWQHLLKFNYSQINYLDLTYPRVSEYHDDQVTQIYTLVLITRNPSRKITLAKFGGIMTQNPIFRKAAEMCAESVSKHTGVRFGLKKKEVPLGEFQDKYVCKNCGHRLHPDSEVILCKYCGGKEIEIVAGTS